MTNEERILTVPQMIFCEKRSEELGVSLAKLMNNAGEKLGRRILEVCMERNVKKVAVLIGKGNNGGDGSVAANFLFESGVSPTIILCQGKPDTELSKAAFERLHKDIPVFEYDGDDSHDWAYAITESDITADCIFGTGFKGEIRDDMIMLFAHLQTYSDYIIACDIPSGANARNGQASKFTLKANETLTMHRKKLGMMLSPAKYLCGKITVCDIGIPQDDDTENAEEMRTKILDADQNKNSILNFLPHRDPWGHKGTFGKIVSVCGSESYIGAAGISALAALRSGVGLVELCTPRAVINSLSSRILECTYSAMKTDEHGFMTSENAPAILKKLEKASVLLLGCGLGHTEETEKLVKELVENSPCPIILDADGINSLVPNIDVLLKKKQTVILTPHPAELARLCGVSTAQILSDRANYASGFAKEYGVTIVSKSAETLICHGNEVLISSAGNTALAKGGSGDMLAGITASLVAQAGQKPDSERHCAMLGCYVMGKTAEMLSEERSERGILASDIIDALPYYFKRLEE